MGTDLSGPVGGGWETDEGCGGGVAGGTRLLKTIFGPPPPKGACAILIFVQNWNFLVNGLQDSFLFGKRYRGLDDLATVGRISSTFLEERKAQRFEAKSLLLGVRLQEFYGIWGFCG